MSDLPFEFGALFCYIFLLHFVLLSAAEILHIDGGCSAVGKFCVSDDAQLPVVFAGPG